MKSYYIHDGSQQLGPFDFNEIKSQKLSRKTPVWYDGLSDWTPLEKVPELQALANTPPPFNITMPPPIFPMEESTQNLVNEEIYAKRKSLKLPIVIGCSVLFAVLGWLIYSNTTQAAIIENVQEEQWQEKSDKFDKEEERKRINEELTIKNMNYRNNWQNYISAGNGNYSTSGLGGIYGLEVIVTNNTEYMLEEVLVDVRYIKANGAIWKTIQVPVRNVRANSNKSVPVEDVERGVSVDISINTVASKKMHFLYSSDYFSGNSSDPNFFK